MAWEKRGDKSYFYRSVRVGGVTRKLYYGGGLLGNLVQQSKDG